MPVTQRALTMPPFHVMEVLEAAQRMERQGKHIIHLEIGEPDFDTPQCIKDAACAAIAAGHTHYTHSLGIPELRTAIAGSYRANHGVEVDPDRILVTQGTSPAMLLLFSALLEPGDEAILSDPCYACYPNLVSFCGGVVKRVPVVAAERYQYRVARVREAVGPRTKAVVVNSPANPTGTLLSLDRMKALAELADEKGFYLVSDEIYNGLVYEGAGHSVLEATDNAFVLNGFSKLYAMTGWRLGYVIAPEKFMRPMQKLCQNLFISANAPAQWAGVAALTDPAAARDVEAMRRTYAERRTAMLTRLKAMGLALEHDPTGAFYILVDMRTQAERFGGSSLKLAYDILERAHLGVTPGIDFGPGAEGHIRFSYANGIDNIEQGMDRLERYLKDF